MDALRNRIAEVEASRAREAALAREEAEEATARAARLSLEASGAREAELAKAHQRELQAAREEAVALRAALKDKEASVKEELQAVGVLLVWILFDLHLMFVRLCVPVYSIGSY